MFHQHSPLQISGECAPACTLYCCSVHQTYAMSTTLEKNHTIVYLLMWDTDLIPRMMS